tara:strand:+ start:2173 stop:3996 length:1824 start_codon:yes stop_codon:yes gene_type:complete
MCGIFAILNNKSSFDNSYIEDAFNLLNARGPESSKFNTYSDKLILGFKRLAINGLNIASDQPITINGITLICNGEIYNYKCLYKELYESHNIIAKTDSDCEVIIYLYKIYGIEQTLRLLDGVFSFILYDNSDITTDTKIYIARDPFGVRPLFILRKQQNVNNDKNIFNNSNVTKENIIGFSSEMKALYPIYSKGGQSLMYTSKLNIFNNTKSKENSVYKSFEIIPFEPGSYSKYTFAFKVNSEWKNQVQNKKYISTCFPSTMLNFNYENHMDNIYDKMVFHLENAVKKRVVGTSDRPIVCLLSGGLDSSLITAFVKKHYDGELQTFSIGMKGSEDLKNAKEVADYLQTKHTEVILTEDEFFNAIPNVIKTIESYDTTTVRASVGNYLIGKYIKENTDAKVVFNGDGSDELTGGYLYFLKSPSSIEFDNECRRLLENIHYFDVLRSDRCISSHGLEPRTPFLDRTFVNYYLSLPIKLRNPLTSNITSFPSEKNLLRKAIEYKYPDLLPQNILWRTKEAFSDGVSGNSGSWFEIIQKKLSVINIKNTSKLQHNIPTTNEQIYYRNIYDSHYFGTEKCIPYFWMPKYVDAHDCSARTLKIYDEISTKLVK